MIIYLGYSYENNTLSTQAQWGVLHKSTIAVSPDTLFPREGPASETMLMILYAGMVLEDS